MGVRNLEKISGNVEHGKSDEYFDAQMKKVDGHALLQTAEPSSYSLPASWVDKSKPPTDLPVVHVSLGSESDKPKPQALIMFGEHGRELISSEVGMSFLEAVHDVACTTELKGEQSLATIQESEYGTDTPYSKDQIRSLLDQWDLAIMPVVSPSAREIAESKDFCNRKNSNQVDVNRNYPFHFGEGKHDKNSDQFPGERPLTEPETIIASKLASELSPKLFVAVHSGAEMIVTSPAYRPWRLEQMPDGVQKVVRSLHQKDCPECTAGPASQVLPYLAYGCSMDYMYEQGFNDEADATKPSHQHFAFTFETWSGEKEKGSAVKEADFEKVFGESAGTLKQQENNFKGLSGKVGERQYQCLQQFNPPPSMYEKTRAKWTKALFSTLAAVGQEVRGQEKSQAKANAETPKPDKVAETPNANAI